MTDETIFQEVDEDLRRDQYTRLWKRYRWYVLGGAVLIVIGVGGWLWWDDTRTREREESGDRFMTATALAATDPAAAAAQLSAMGDASGEYPVLARFAAASALGDTDRAAGMRAYDAIAADTAIDPVLRDLARVRAGYIAVDLESYEAVSARVASVLTPANPWRVNALEVLALAAFAAGRTEEAREQLGELIADEFAQTEVKNRAQTLLALLDAGMPTTTLAALTPAAPQATTTPSPFDFTNLGGTGTTTPPATTPTTPTTPQLPVTTNFLGSLPTLGGTAPGLDLFSNRLGLPNLGTTATPAGGGTLSSTVGSEAWNSRDLKSRPH